MPSDFFHERRIISDDIVIWELRGLPSMIEWRSLLNGTGRWLLEQESRGRKWGMLVDPSGLVNISAELRNEAGRWRAENMALIANTCICASYVAPNPLLRGAIATIFWFARPVVPVSVRRTREEAHQWIVAKLNDSSLSA